MSSVAALVALIALAVAGRASAFVYFNGFSNAIARANNDGTGVNEDFMFGLKDVAQFVAVSGSDIYWENGDNHIARANINGGDVDPDFITTGSTTGIRGLAVGDGYIFWINADTDAIGRASITGSGVDQSLIPALPNNPCGLAVGATDLYWETDDADVGTAAINGTGENPNFIPTDAGFCGVAVDATHIYWANLTGTSASTSSIGRANLDGTGIDQNFVSGIAQDELNGIVVSSSRIYWALSLSDEVGSSTISGTGVNNAFIVQEGGGSVSSVAVDSLTSPVLQKTANADPVKGTVLVQVRGSHSFVPLSAAKSIPFGSTVDATSGTVSLQTAVSHGKVQTAEFYGGQFQLTQARDGLVSLKLNAPLSCGGHGVLEVARKRPKKKKRILWGDGHGGYRTVGGYGAGTVLGTKWETIDSCSETEFKVAEGEIKVTNFRKHKTVVVKAPHSYVARP
jgi:virginiamycin B lyase